MSNDYAIMRGPMGTERTVHKDSIKQLEAEGYRVVKRIPLPKTSRAAQKQVEVGKWVEMETPDKTVVNVTADQVPDYEAQGYAVVKQVKALEDMTKDELLAYAAENHPDLTIASGILKAGLLALIQEAEKVKAEAETTIGNGSDGGSA